MPKDAPGRNDPCPCGSGKKYKKCCWKNEPIERGPEPTPETSSWKDLSFAERAQIAEETDRLDEISNGALDAIKAKRYDEAERLCEELLQKYPEVIDGHDRLGMLREAQGRFQEAADCYTKVLAMIEQTPEAFDPQVPEMFRRCREDVLAKIRSVS